MPDNILDGHGATLLIAIIVVAVALLALVGVFWLIRRRSSSTFVRGGRGRQPRLAVLDAAAVDTKRRIVLIRRDDVEHLVMIGGPTDVVIESRIVQLPGEPADQPPPADTRQVPPAHMPTPVAMADPAQRPEASAAPAPAAQQQSRTPRPQPVTRSRPDARPQPAAAQPGPRLTDTARPASSAHATIAATAATATTVGAMQSDAANALESARARVFKEPDFSDAVLNDLPSASATTPDPAHAPSTARPVEPASDYAIELPGYSEILADQKVSSSPPDPTPTSAPTPAAAERQAPAGDFESVLAAELSEDLLFDELDDGFLDAPDQDATAASGVAPAQTPEVKPDTSPSRDSLEAEMERLLGDMTRKPS